MRQAALIFILRCLPLFFTLLGLADCTVITNDTASLVNSSFEYIVIGGGTTALAVANRLAVNHSVLVVERGPDLVNDEAINDPFTTFGTPSPCHFQIQLAPQMGFNGSRMIPMTYGSCLGGSSSINTMIGSRPTYAGMTAVEALGNPGWGWNEFLPFMQKSETFHPPNPTQHAEGANFLAVVHGFDGPVGVSFAQPLVAPTLQDAAKNTTNTVFEGAVALSPDMGDGFSGGHYSSYYHHIHFNKTLQMDRRSSSAWSYLYPQTEQRAGLTVLVGHRINTISTSGPSEAGENITVTGVLVEPTGGGSSSAFNASREVVLSAGALYSPAILQRSGIGNATFLQSLGIEPVLDLPGVGANFQDQILLTNVSFSIAPSANITNITGGGEVLLAVVVAHPTAIDTLGPNGTSAMNAMLRNISAEQALSTGGIVGSKTLTTQAALTADAYEIDHPLIEIFYTPGPTAINVWAQSVLPLSRGTIRINSTDPSVDPIADAQYLTTEVDMVVAVAAARKVSSIAVTPPFSDLLVENALAEAGVPQVGATDEEVSQWVLSTYTPGTHPIGSNSMMPRELGGVVSPELLVYGTTNLRIADASIVPLSVFPHTTLGLYGVAEKAADMILQTATENL
ncbi:alcohol oxidase [Lentinula raphanica]|uniref:Alcohol oxidase n=1 Tax=Lentinula raphanica TaxID=153919 RepID=A0AA38UER2_9AGAR|nr:alcohol oxidase [Lentinula raphanica]KAJ3838591.1 alcohol oxidase [Lentinula raphanica]KAJ3975275.1 alcohol oxidase [Lentinula raphanica]